MLVATQDSDGRLLGSRSDESEAGQSDLVKEMTDRGFADDDYTIATVTAAEFQALLQAVNGWRVPREVIVQRLKTADKLAAADTAIQSDLELRERWYAHASIRNDDEDAIALLTAIGADPDVILAPEGE